MCCAGYGHVRMSSRLVVLTGAGMSAESGLATFRGSDGLWEGHRIEEVASPEGWKRDPEKVLRFYNERRAQLLKAKPNAGHCALTSLEAHFDVRIITQNIDDLHERAGASCVLHLHGELRKAQSTQNPDWVCDIAGDTLSMGDRCPDGHQLRPNVVWFGEAVPRMQTAIQWVQAAHIMLIVGTSLVVYPAAGLVDCLPHTAHCFMIDPQLPAQRPIQCKDSYAYTGTAAQTLPKLAKRLIDEFA